MSATETKWFVYIILTDANTYYTGITTDVERRWREHSGLIAGKGAKYFRGRLPKELVYVEALGSRSEASRREAAIKRLSRKEKNGLIDTANGVNNWIDDSYKDASSRSI